MPLAKCRRAGHDLTDPRNLRTRKDGYHYCGECDRQRFRQRRWEEKNGGIVDRGGPKLNCRRGHPFDEANTIIRRKPDGTVLQRKCRACKNANRRKAR